MANKNLTNAKRAKNDEFYTQYSDIQKEIEAYLEYDSDVFRGKIVYCNCDDPFESNFFRYFVLNFVSMNIKKAQLMVSQQEDRSIILDLQVIGTGSPRTLLLSGVHGNEKTGQLIISKLLEKLPEFTGTLAILPIANPIGFTDGSREESVSGLDLNRQFSNGANEGPIGQLVGTIANLATQQDYVIDLHNFTTDGLVQVASNHIGYSDTLATLFRPDVVRIPAEEQVLKKTGTLRSYLKNAGVPYVLVEVPTHEKITQEKISRIVAGIVSHLTKCIDYKKVKSDDFTALRQVTIRKVTSDRAGLFILSEKISLGSPVLEGEVLGSILDPSDNSSHPVRSPYSGIICEMDNDEKRVVVLGDVLMRVGQD